MTKQKCAVIEERQNTNSFVIRPLALFRASSFVIRHLVNASFRLPLRTLPIVRTNVLLSGSGGVRSTRHRAADLFNPEPERRATARLEYASGRTGALSSRGKGTAGRCSTRRKKRESRRRHRRCPG